MQSYCNFHIKCIKCMIFLQMTAVISILSIRIRLEYIRNTNIFNLMNLNNAQVQANWTQFQCLHPSLISALTFHKLSHPTSIQAEVFEYFPHYHDFLIAAQTGSGKTLAFAAPILSEMMYAMEKASFQCLPRRVLGLILTPTRQLAQQIHDIFQMALSNINANKQVTNQLTIASIVGGMSKQKQLRILSQHKPHIIIGTPGRIYELLQQEALSFQYLKYLVLDQADRMIELGHFKEVDGILEKIFKPKVQQFFDKEVKQIQKQLEQPGKQTKSGQGEYYVKENGRKKKIKFDINSIATDQLFEVPMQMFKIFTQSQEPEMINQDEEQQNQVKKKKKSKERQPDVSIVEAIPPLAEDQKKLLNQIKRRIFFISATLTHQFKGTKYFVKKSEKSEEERKKQKKEKRDKKNGIVREKQEEEPNKQKSLQEHIPKLKALLSRASFSAKPKIVDQSSLIFLPPHLIQKISYVQDERERISFLLSYLKHLPPNAKAIIFTNTIKISKRVQFFLEGFNVHTFGLHSHMQQKQRIKKLQQFKRKDGLSILIATDVAARGLDFQISNVIQYNVPINGDTYVHRAGRTARAGRTGECLLLVDKKQNNRWQQINEIISSGSSARRVQKYNPIQTEIDQLKDRVEQLEWVRINEEKRQGLRAKQIEEMEAEQLGVQVQPQQTRKRFDLSKEQKMVAKHQLKKKIQLIKQKSLKRTQSEKEESKWRKNKLVLSLEDIKKLL